MLCFRTTMGSLGGWIYDLVMWPLEIRWGKGWRIALWRGVHGRVLEIGVGTGANVPYYPEGAQVTAVDIGEGMLSRARHKARGLGRDADFRMADVHSLPFPNESFDFVVGSFVLCSVRDPLRALAEIRRVLSPSGEVRLLEHVRPKNERLGRVLDRIAPHFAKRTWELFPTARLQVETERALDRHGLVRLYVLRR
jgi:ubiquinone/menaquinone biosynthesis C-methylase UbiE